MLVLEDGFADVPTPFGPMRCYVFRPKPAIDGVIEERFPGLVLFSEIFQMTGPVKRTAVLLAGHGFVVLVPEVYHELLPAGTILTYTPEDSARGNACKKDKELASYDADAAAAVAYLERHPACSGRVGAAGMCLGGGLAFRAALQPKVRAAVCWYATDLHTAALSKTGDDSLARAGEVQGRLLMLWGTADPHVPLAGRRKIYDAFVEKGLSACPLRARTAPRRAAPPPPPPPSPRARASPPRPTILPPQSLSGTSLRARTRSCATKTRLGGTTQCLRCRRTEWRQSFFTAGCGEAATSLGAQAHGARARATFAPARMTLS